MSISTNLTEKRRSKLNLALTQADIGSRQYNRLLRYCELLDSEASKENRKLMLFSAMNSLETDKNNGLLDFRTVVEETDLAIGVYFEIEGG